MSEYVAACAAVCIAVPAPLPHELTITWNWAGFLLTGLRAPVVLKVVEKWAWPFCVRHFGRCLRREPAGGADGKLAGGDQGRKGDRGDPGERGIRGARGEMGPKGEGVPMEALEAIVEAMVKERMAREFAAREAVVQGGAVQGGAVIEDGEKARTC